MTSSTQSDHRVSDDRIHVDQHERGIFATYGWKLRIMVYYGQTGARTGLRRLGCAETGVGTAWDDARG